MLYPIHCDPSGVAPGAQRNLAASSPLGGYPLKRPQHFPNLGCLACMLDGAARPLRKQKCLSDGCGTDDCWTKSFFGASAVARRLQLTNVTQARRLQTRATIPTITAAAEKCYNYHMLTITYLYG
jgi:hypothetical protein